MPLGTDTEEIKIRFGRLNEKRKRLLARIQVTYEMIAALPKNKLVFFARAEKLPELFTEFNSLLDDLVTIELEDPQFKAEAASSSELFEERYFYIMAAAKDHGYVQPLDASFINHSTNSGVQELKPKLPKIQLIKFDSQIQNFASFQSLFEALIHNSELSNIEKFSYLLANVDGFALQLLKTVEFQPQNYEIAYKLLKDRYTNPRVIGNFYLDKLLTLTSLKSDSDVRSLSDTIITTVASIKALQIPDLADFILLHLGLRLLDPKTRKSFENKFVADKFPTFKNFQDYMTSQSAIADVINSPRLGTHTVPPNRDRKRVLIANDSHVSSSPSPQRNSPTMVSINRTSACMCCQKSLHTKLKDCERFLAMSISDRKNFIAHNQLCFACFARHPVSKCQSSFSCRICHKKSHNSLLHQDTRPAEGPFTLPSTSSAPNPSASRPSTSGTNSVSLANTLPICPASSTTLLGTAKAVIFDCSGRPHSCRLVLDSGSQTNLISSSLADRLGLPRTKCSFDISGVGHSSVSRQVQGLISCRVASHHAMESSLIIEAAIIPRITSDLPTSPLPDDLRSKFSSLTLADPDFSIPNPVDLLLGIQAVLDATLDYPGIIKGSPSAVPTIFGYVLMGAVPIEPSPRLVNSLFMSFSPSDNFQALDHTLRAFWEQEELSVPTPFSDRELQCEQHFADTISRDSTGRYVARLPFVDNIPPTLGSTRNRALKRFLRLEKQFESDPKFRDLYHECLQDYARQGHMVVASTPSDYILTHHGVMKGSGDNLKIRVVFNPSEKDPSGTSLNNSLLAGPKLQGDIGEIVSRFRTHKVAITCDIRQMYRAINLHLDDQIHHHFFWRFSPSDPITEWQLTTVTFGVTSSPFTAQATIRQLVMDEGEKYPLAAIALRNEIYIDDLLCGAPLEADAAILCEQLTSLLGAGGFQLGKWGSSSPNLLKDFPSDALVSLPGDSLSPNTIKVLGVAWDPVLDVFCCRIDTATSEPSKRGILSKVARMFDPTGYFSPVIFSMKVLLQQLWLLKNDWDEPLPPDIAETWNLIEAELCQLEQIKIPRCLLPIPYTSLQLVGFSDASERGMSAVLYLRVVTNDDISLKLIKSKTKVAPLKSWTIPRLELGAAHLLARLLQSTSGLIDHLSITRIICWTDSSTTLSWLKTPPYRLKSFVSARVVDIHDLIPTAEWRFVPGTLNPADVGSRGILPSKLIDHDLWWNGPSFLKKLESEWPPVPALSFANLSELKEPSVLQFHSLTTTSMDNSILLKIQNSSSLLKLQRIVSYIIRFVDNCRASVQCKTQMNIRSGPISAVEYRNALSIMIKVTQAYHFSADILSIKKFKECSNRLASLSPFLSPDGFLRVGGRLAWAPITESAKRPVLIPSSSHLSRLLVDHYHIYSAHGGPRLVQSLINREFWIPSARNLIRQRIHKCVTCRRHAAPIVNPLMADLPKSRVTAGRCFAHTGVDFGGPFPIRFSTRRNSKIEKGYFALFVCMATRAAHIEVVSALTTEACLAAIDRFIARRSLPSHIYSDNGRNFLGAAREIKEISSFIQQASPEIQSCLAKRQITWVFNPPLAPHFGGAWERLIRSTKQHLKRCIGDQCLTFEEYATLFSRIEAILNSRPLVALPSTPNDPADCLTPGHFLVGGPLLSRPEPDLLAESPNRLKRWQLVSQLIQSFWRRWSSEYLQSLQPRSKWTKKTGDLAEGAVVVLRTPNSAPTQWPLGRVEQVMPGSDGTVRVVRVRTPSGVLVRPTNKLVVLPTD